MEKQSKYRSEYINEYGEEWIFDYNPSTRRGILKGSDVDWEEYEVIDGRVDGLILNKGELLWLQKTWSKTLSLLTRET
jgi:hypothetical protein